MSSQNDEGSVGPKPPFDHHAFLSGLLQRPAMFTGESTLRSIHVFLEGYRSAIQNSGVQDQSVIPWGLGTGEFHGWTAYRLRHPNAGYGWESIISERFDSEEERIEQFRRLVEEYRHRKPTVVARLIGLPMTYQTGPAGAFFPLRGKPAKPHLASTHWYPQSISLVTYTDDPGFFAYSDTDDPLPGRGFYPTMKRFESEYGVTWNDLIILDPTWSPRYDLDD
ncbi:MAG: hypothetical protein AAFN13_17255 [Bacteroidota bacterium]